MTSVDFTEKSICRFVLLRGFSGYGIVALDSYGLEQAEHGGLKYTMSLWHPKCGME